MPATLEAPVQTSPPRTIRKHRWPEADFYVSEQHRLVYCPIHKIASSSLKLWWAMLVDGSSSRFVSTNEYGQLSIDHYALDTSYKLRHLPAELGRRPITESGWTRAVFVRNPWARVVSAFVNKFVTPHELAKPVFEKVHHRQTTKAWSRMPFAIAERIIHGRRVDPGLGNRSHRPLPAAAQSWQDEMNFSQFVDFLAGCSLDRGTIDRHWSPQYRFLGSAEFNFVGRFEHLERDVAKLARLLDVDVALPAANRTTYTNSYRRLFADCPLKRLRRLPSMPDYRQFYTPELRTRVARLYRRDIEQFGYSFDD
jgi:hypothetical protein